MTHRDTIQSKVRFNFEYLKLAMEFLLRDTNWGTINWRTDCTWGSPRLLTIVALMWAWSDEKLVADRFSTARRIALTMYPLSPKVAKSFQGFMKLLLVRTLNWFS